MEGGQKAHKTMQAPVFLTTTLQRFRLGAAPLAGNDHVSASRGERLCKLCSTREVEDEKHFLLECPAYENLRRESRWRDLFNQTQDMKAVMGQKDQLKLARYLLTASKVRRRHLEALAQQEPRLDDFSSSDSGEGW